MGYIHVKNVRLTLTAEAFVLAPLVVSVVESLQLVLTNGFLSLDFISVSWVLGVETRLIASLLFGKIEGAIWQTTIINIPKSREER